MAMKSSENATAVLEPELGQILPSKELIGNIWLNTESVLLNINSNITSLTLINNYGTLTQTTTFIPRVFEIASLFTGLFSAGQTAGNIVNEEVDGK